MLVLFDIDDTLLNDKASMMSAISDMQSTLNPQEDPDIFLSQWVESSARHYKRYLRGEVSAHAQRRLRLCDVSQHALDDDVVDKLIVEYLANYESYWRLFDDTLECLEKLKEHKLGVITNGETDQQTRKLQRCGLLDRFSFVITSEEFGYPKPDKRIFQHACEQAGVAASEAIYIGDKLQIDALGAANAGLTGVWLNRDNAATSGAEAVRVISGLQNLHSLISQLDAIRYLKVC